MGVRLKVSGVDEEDESVPGGAKRKGGKDDPSAVDAVAQRQLAWMQHGPDSAGKSATFRPVKLHRTSARWWLVCLDNQLRTSTHLAGLVDFQWSPQWSQDWKAWPGLAVSMDLGPDGVSAVHGMLNHWDMLLWVWPDESHAHRTNCAHNSLVLTHLERMH